MSTDSGYQTQILKDFIPADILDLLKTHIRNVYSSLSEKDLVHAPHGYYYPAGEEVHNIVNKVLPLMPNEVCSSVNMLVHTKPTGPHTDTNLSDTDFISDPNHFARTFIIPLETQPTHTITFEQVMPLGTLGNDMPEFIDSLPNLNALSQSEIDRYFHSFARPYWTSKLSIETVFPWIAGDVLVFDRHRVHTGDDHLGQVDKQGLVIWTTLS